MWCAERPYSDGDPLQRGDRDDRGEGPRDRVGRARQETGQDVGDDRLRSLREPADEAQRARVAALQGAALGQQEVPFLTLLVLAAWTPGLANRLLVAILALAAVLPILTLLVRTATLPVMLVPFAQSDPQIAATLAILFLAPTLVALGAVARPLLR